MHTPLCVCVTSIQDSTPRSKPGAEGGDDAAMRQYGDEAGGTSSLVPGTAERGAHPGTKPGAEVRASARVLRVALASAGGRNVRLRRMGSILAQNVLVLPRAPTGWCCAPPHTAWTFCITHRLQPRH